MASGLVTVAWIPTLESVADILTKVLSKDLTERHRKSLGICELTGPEPWQLEAVSPKSKAKKRDEPNTSASEVLEGFAIKPSPRSLFKSFLSDIEDDPTCNMVLIDICTSGRAGFGQIAGKINGLRVVSVTSQTPIQTVSGILKSWMHKLQKRNVKFCIWMSPPCTGGSPMMNFVEPGRRAEIVKRHFAVLVEILEHCEWIRAAQFRALELSHFCSFWKEEAVTSFLSRQELNEVQRVDRCPYAGAPAAVVARHSYRVAASHEGLFHKLKTCACSEHTPLSRQSLDELGEYPYSLALVLARRMVSCV